MFRNIKIKLNGLILIPFIFLTFCNRAEKNKNNIRYIDKIFNSVRVLSDISYGTSVTWDGKIEVLKLDLYEPEGDTEQKRPAIVWLHGGGFISGDKTNISAIKLAKKLAKRGYVFVSINYRLVSDARFADDPEGTINNAMHDAKSAVRWLRANASVHRIDTSHIAIGGSSAGAYAAVHAAYKKDEGKSGNPDHSSAVTAVMDFWGGIYQNSSIESGKAPILIIHGTADTSVPFSEAEKLIKLASKANIPFKFYPLEGYDHAQWTDLNLYLSWILPFLYEYNTNRLNKVYNATHTTP